MTIRSQEPHDIPGIRTTGQLIRLILRRSDLFPSARTLWQFWRVVPPQYPTAGQQFLAYVRPQRSANLRVDTLSRGRGSPMRYAHA